MAPSHLRAPESTTHGTVARSEPFYDLYLLSLSAVWLTLPEDSTPGAFMSSRCSSAWCGGRALHVRDRYESDDALHRLLMVTQMFGVAGLAATFQLDDHGLAAVAVPFAASYAVTRTSLVAMYTRVWWHVEASRPLVTGYIRGFGLDTLLWVVSIFAGEPLRYWLWGLAMCISLSTPWLMRRTPRQAS
jgi:low temperature requirement protein LtrA